MTEKRTRDQLHHRRLTADEAEELREQQMAEAAQRKRVDDAARQVVLEHDRRVRRFLLRLSLANWGIAVLAWVVSAFLGITSPASIIIYSVLFVIGLVAAILAILTYLVEKFGHEPAFDELAGEGDAGDDVPAASSGDAPAAAGV